MTGLSIKCTVTVHIWVILMKNFLVRSLFLCAGLSASFASAQTLSWTIDGHQNVLVGGVPGREGIGAAVFNTDPLQQPQYTRLYTVYTPTNDPVGDQYGDNYIHIMSTEGGGMPYGDQRTQSNTGTVMSDANPSLTASGATSLHGPYLYLAANSQQQGGGFGGYTNVFRSTDALHFEVGPQPYLGIWTDYSPSLTTDPATNDVYLGVRNIGDHTLALCRLAAATDQWTCQNFPGSRHMGFNPGLAFWNGVLYVGFVEEDNAHRLRMFTSYDQGQTINENTDIANSDASSSNPSLVVYNNRLYVGFRSNDSGHNFLYKYSTNGLNYSGSYTTNNTKLGGAPMMVSAEGLPYYSNQLWNFNSANDSTHWFWSEYAY